MKRILAAIFAVVCAVPTFSQSDDNLVKLSILLESHAYRQKDRVEEMRQLSQSLSGFQKLQFYDKYKTSGWWCLLNIFGGLGSWIQGDAGGGAVTTGSMFGGAGIAALGSRPGPTTTTPSGTTRTTVIVTNRPVYAAGVTIELSGLIYGLWAPWDFEAKDNARLRRALSME